MDELLDAIKTKLLNSALWNDVGGRCDLDETPAGVLEYPRVVYFIVSDIPQKTWTEDMENVTVQFSLFSSSTGHAEIAGMYAHLTALFDECDMTITGSTLVWMRRQNLTTMVEDIATAEGTNSQVKHWAVDYEIITSLN